MSDFENMDNYINGKCLHIAAGIVLFEPEINRLKENIDAIIGQCDHIYVFDNGSSNYSQISDLLNLYSPEKLDTINSSNNKGIAYALNVLCDRAFIDGYDWLLTLDQDSVCPRNMILEYKMHLNTDTTDAALLCPLIVDRNVGKLSTPKGSVELVKKCITSGSLVLLKIWKKIGGFDEVLFIDGVDFDYCKRLLINNMKIYRINNISLYHELGKMKVYGFGGIKIHVKNHSYFRKYYIARNTIYLSRKNGKSFSCVKAWGQNIKLLMITILFEKEKKIKIKKIIAGSIDGMKMSINNC